MFPLVYTNPIAGALFAAACLAWLVPEMIGMLPQMARVSRKNVVVQDHGSMAVLIGLQWAGLALNFGLAWLWPAAAIARGEPGWLRTALFVSGVVFIILGVALRWYAIRTLGRFFTRDVAVAESQHVVQSGPYRLIRHPAYSGTFLTMLGVGLAMTNWASLVALLVCVFAGHLYRVRIEEKALIRTIGQPYIEYMRRTRRFIPLLF
jgi:protein-S-isoprenylcysteine O-methyltransferase Ste14